MINLFINNKQMFNKLQTIYRLLNYEIIYRINNKFIYNIYDFIITMYLFNHKHKNINLFIIIIDKFNKNRCILLSLSFYKNESILFFDKKYNKILKDKLTNIDYDTTYFSNIKVTNENIPKLFNVFISLLFSNP